MKWASYDLNWGRPLRSIITMFNNKVVNFKFSHLESSNIAFFETGILPKGQNEYPTNGIKNGNKGKRINAPRRYIKPISHPPKINQIKFPIKAIILFLYKSFKVFFFLFLAFIIFFSKKSCDK